MFSATASITQSQSLSFARSSSKLPIVMRAANSGAAKAAGLDFFSPSRACAASLLGSPGCAMSSRSTVKPAFAMCAAMREPIVPAPNTAMRRIG